jgi:hypothetical protein
MGLIGVVGDEMMTSSSKLMSPFYRNCHFKTIIFDRERETTKVGNVLNNHLFLNIIQI